MKIINKKLRCTKEYKLSNPFTRTFKRYMLQRRTYSVSRQILVFPLIYSKEKKESRTMENVLERIGEARFKGFVALSLFYRKAATDKGGRVVRPRGGRWGGFPLLLQVSGGIADANPDHKASRIKGIHAQRVRDSVFSKSTFVRFFFKKNIFFFFTLLAVGPLPATILLLLISKQGVSR